MERQRVVVTGLGAVTPLGLSAEVFWKGCLAGRSAAGPITGFDASGFEVRFACELPDFDPTRWLDRKEARRLDPFCQYAVAAADQALADAGIDAAAWPGDRDRIGIILGTGIGGLHELEAQHGVLMERGPGRVSPFLIPKLMGNASAGNLAIRYGFRGPNFVTVSACASSNHAIGQALRAIRLGESDVVLTGGSEATITPLGMSGFINMGALSRRNDDPGTASRPFDAGRDGFVMGEGAGVLVLESLEHARKRDARVYAELAGFGQSDDASHITAPDEEGTGAVRAMNLALQDAALAPGDIDYVNAHGTSTPYNDRTETRALKRVFGDHASRLLVSSTKSMVGHLLGASGGVEAVATVLTLHEGRVHPTINQQARDPDCDLDYVPNEARDHPVRAAIANSFGFGGHNATIAFRRI